MGPLHLRTQKEIQETLESLGFDSKCEYRGNGWRADVYAERGNCKVAFEVQLSPQSYKKTKERQALYLRDGINACWLFENDPSKKKEEEKDLPGFRIFEEKEALYVSLKERKELPLGVFVRDFAEGKIKFCRILTPLPMVEVNIIEFPCYKCGAINHIYSLSPFKSACNVRISELEAEEMWSDNKFSFDARIVEKVKEYVKRPGKEYINLATIKKRFSNTVGDSYLSFGCADCDALFGDFFVRDAILDSLNGDGVVEKFSFETDAAKDFKQDIPHWCHPGENKFCE